MKTLFPLIAAVFFSMLHYLFYTRVVSHLAIKPATRSKLKTALLLNLVFILAYLGSRYLFTPPKLLYFFLSLSVGVGFVLFFSLIVYELLRLSQRLIPFNPEKRAFFKRTSDLGFLSLGGVYFSAAAIEGSKSPVVEFVEVNQNRFQGKSYRIVQISDMHIGGLIDQEFVARSVATINALKPDLIAITGDLSDAHIHTIQSAIDELRGLQSRFGTFYVIGNHEYFHSLEETIAYIKTLGIHVLENTSHRINDDFNIVGVYDLFGFRAQTHLPDISQAMEGIAAETPTLLLAHQPKYVEFLEGYTPSLMLSGHTHGGQIWPFHYLVRLAQPYLKGLYPLGENRHIYVNSGIGFWGPPMRLGASAEITCITWS